jgi:hypothetical protein
MNGTKMLAKVMLLAMVVASGIFVSPVAAQSPETKPSVATQSTAAAGQDSAPSAPTHYQPNRFAGRARTYYELVWGVDSLSVKVTESGEVIRFSYRVLDADKAKPLNDKNAEPSLMDPKAGVQLVVPSLEKVGKLRQSSAPLAGRSYWMAFSNKGRLVKRGDRVSVVIGQFRADGLVVD